MFDGVDGPVDASEREPQGQNNELQQHRQQLVAIIDRALDRGFVIKARTDVPVLGIDEALTIEAGAFVASIETCLRYAEAIVKTACPALPPPSRDEQAEAGSTAFDRSPTGLIDR
jgi:hypothetical protein